jgi:hypothetical protein
VVLGPVEVAVFDQHAVPGAGMHRGMSFFAFKDHVEHAYPVAGPDEDAFVPVLELAVAYPAVFDVFHGQCHVGIIVDGILMVQEFLRVVFPVAGEQDIFHPALFQMGIGMELKRSRRYQLDIQVQRVFELYFFTFYLLDGVDLADLHAAFLPK